MDGEKLTVDGVEVVVFFNDHVRQRPGMYIGDTGPTGLRNLVDWLILRAAHGARQDPARTIAIDLLPEDGLRIYDDGPTIPLDEAGGTGKRLPELLLTRYIAAGPLDRRKPWLFYQRELHCACALSSRFILEIDHTGQRWQQEFAQGKPVNSLAVVGAGAERATCFSLWPDPDIFTEGRSLDHNQILERARQIAGLHPSIRLSVTDHRLTQPVREEFYYPHGLTSLFHHWYPGLRPLCRAEGREGEMEFEAVFCWQPEIDNGITGFVNSELISQGVHSTGVQVGCFRTLKGLLKERELEGKRNPVERRDFLEGLRAIIAVWHPEPIFQAPTRDNLNNPEVTEFVRDHVADALRAFLATHPGEADALAERICVARDARLCAQWNRRNRRV